MNTPEEFAREARAWLGENLPPDLPYACDSPATLSRMMAWERKLHSAGYRAISWPVEHGGRGLPEAYEWAFQDEYERAVGSTRVDQVGQRIVAPVLMRVGSHEQQERWLRPIAECTQLWALGLSEPEAGSDLKSVSTRAVPAEGGYVVKGTKIWTSGAQFSRWMFTLVRTPASDEANRGLSVLAVDLQAPGLRVEPIRQIHGQSEFCEVGLDDVFVPEDCLIGTPGEGWSLVRLLLDFERSMISSGLKLREQIRVLRQLTEEVAVDVNPVHSRAVIALESRLTAYRGLVDSLRRSMELDLPLNAWSSVGKLAWSQLGADVHEAVLMTSTMGEPTACQAAIDGDNGGARGNATEQWKQLEYEYWQSRAGLIYGGALEVQLGIVADGLLR